jgi:hypothetical protein
MLLPTYCNVTFHFIYDSSYVDTRFGVGVHRILQDAPSTFLFRLSIPQIYY